MEKELLTLRKEGGSIVLAVTKLLPADWHLVYAQVRYRGKGVVIVYFEQVITVPDGKIINLEL